MDAISEIKSKISIEDLVSKYVNLKPAGKNLKALCPFHSEKTPSFMVSPERQIFHCFGCGKSGDIFTFLQEMEGLSFKEALLQLAQEAGVEVKNQSFKRADKNEKIYEILSESKKFYQRELTKNKQAIEYLKQRGVSSEMVAKFEIGFAPNSWDALLKHLLSLGFKENEIIKSGMVVKSEKIYDRFRGRIMFPIYSATGQTIAFSGRVLPEYDDGKTGKYINSPETDVFVKSDTLFGFSLAKMNIRKFNFALVVEGQLDVVLAFQAGFTNTIAFSGTAVTQSHLKTIKRVTDNILFALDRDSAGVSALKKASKEALKAGFTVKVAPLPEGYDPADLIVKKGASEFKKTVKNALPIIEFLLSDILSSRKGYDALKSVSKEIPEFLQYLDKVEQDYFINMIADKLSVSPESVRETFSLKATQEEAVILQNKKPPAFDEFDLLKKALMLADWVQDKEALSFLQEIAGVGDVEIKETDWLLLEERYSNKKQAQDDLAEYIRILKISQIKESLLQKAQQLRVSPENEETLLAEIAQLQKELKELEANST